MFAGSARTLSVLLLAAAAAPASGQEIGPADVRVEERTPLAFVVIAPTGEVAQIRTSDIIRIVSEVVHTHTNLTVVNLEPDLVQECRGRLLCLVQKVRPDYIQESLRREDGTLYPYQAHLEDLAQRKAVYSKYFVVLTNVTQDGESDRFQLSLVNTDDALQLYHVATHDRSDWEPRVEAAINEAALTGPRETVADPTAARAYIERTVVELFRPVLDRSGHWEVYGSIVLKPVLEGMEITLDGVPVGTTRSGQTRLLGVNPGDRQLGLQHDGFEPFQTLVRVDRNQESTVEVSLVARASGTNAAARQVLFWGGAALGAAGAALVTYAIVAHDSSVKGACFGCGGGSEWIGFGYDPSVANTAGDANPPSLPVAPLGYSLVVTGALWSLGTAFFGDEGSFPWLPLLTGVAAGGLSLGLSAALGGG